MMGTPRRPFAAHHRSHARSAVTLIETAASIAVASVLLTGIGSAIVIASRSIPAENDPIAAVVTAAGVVEQMASELSCLQSVVARSGAAVEFTVADRNGDDVAETIRYAWSGTSGDPLTRQYNAGNIVELIDGVHGFNLGYDLTTITETTVIPEKDYPNQWVVHVDIDQVNPELGFVVSTDTWCGEYFVPNPNAYPNSSITPAETDSWKISYIYIRFKKLGSPGGTTTVQLRGAGADGLPTAELIQQWQVVEKDLSGTSWTQKGFAVSNGPWLPPSQGLCVVVKPASGTDTCQVLHQQTVVPDGNAAFFASTDGGTTWVMKPGFSMTRFRIYATLKTAGSSTSTSQYFLKRTNIALQETANAMSAVSSSVAILNKPEVAAP